MQNLVDVSSTMCTHVKGPKNFGNAGAQTTEMGMQLTPETCHPRVTVPNLVALPQTIQAQVGFLKNVGDAGPCLIVIGAWLITRHTFLLMYHHANLVIRGQMVSAHKMRDPLEKMGTLHPTCQGHWNRYGSISDLWLAISDP